MSEALIIFKAINSDSEKEQFLKKTLQNQDSIYLQDKSSRLHVLKPKGIGTPFVLECNSPEEGARLNLDSSTLTANITLRGESYIFDTRPEICADHIKLPIFNLFHLQKRKNFRYVLPEDYSAKFVFNTLNNNPSSLHCRLLDLSTDGCAIEISLENANLKVADRMEGAIFLGDRPPILVQGYIKNIRPKGDAHLVLGVEFNHMPNASEGLIITSLTDLQREIYFRRSA